MCRMGKAQRTRRKQSAGLDGYVTSFLYPSYGIQHIILPLNNGLIVGGRVVYDGGRLAAACHHYSDDIFK